jgi:hypothetical protein
LTSVRVGDAAGPPLSSVDPTVLAWAWGGESAAHTEDKRTIPAHLAAFLEAGNHSPGVLIVRPASRLAEVVESLALIAHAGEPEDFANMVTYIT